MNIKASLLTMSERWNGLIGDIFEVIGQGHFVLSFIILFAQIH